MAKLSEDNLVHNFKNLLLLWEENLNSALEYDSAHWDSVFDNVKAFISDELLKAIENGNFLSKHDEKVFENYEKLFICYKKVLNLYNKKNSFKNKKISDIADGIYIIISSKIEQISENKSQIEGGYGKYSNPIAMEKENSIFENIEIFSADVFHIISEFRKSFNQFSKPFFNNVKFKNDIIPICKKIYDLYTARVKKCLHYITDLDMRPQLSLYYNAIIQERDELESVINVQYDAISKLGIDIEKQNHIKDIFDELKKCFDASCKYVDEIKSCYKNSSGNINYDFILKYNSDFEKNISDCFLLADDKNKLQYDNMIDKKQKFSDSLNSVLTCYCKNEIENIKPFSIKMNKIINNEMNFSKKLADEFKPIINYTNNKSEELKNTNLKQIIFGISETIQIKIESINENTEAFISECRNICDIKDLKKLNPHKFTEKCFDEVYSIWQKSYEKEKFFENDFKSSINKLLIKNGFPNTEKIQENINKKLMQLKREHIIFEISTFEEIMNYSISKLRETNEQCIVDYVKFIDDVFNNIKYLLDAFNIQFIQPKPHSFFDAKLHNIITAEKNKSFKKGEIIKLINSGYMQNGNVILRANVIAAK